MTARTVHVGWQREAQIVPARLVSALRARNTTAHRFQSNGNRSTVARFVLLLLLLLLLFLKNAHRRLLQRSAFISAVAKKVAVRGRQGNCADLG